MHHRKNIKETYIAVVARFVERIGSQAKPNDDHHIPNAASRKHRRVSFNAKFSGRGPRKELSQHIGNWERKRARNEGICKCARDKRKYLIVTNEESANTSNIEQQCKEQHQSLPRCHIVTVRAKAERTPRVASSQSPLGQFAEARSRP